MKNIALFILTSVFLISSCKKESIKELPAFADYSYSVSNYYNVSFVNKSKNATVYTWDFGDGSALLTEMNPTHTYSIGGTYKVTLNATGVGGENSYYKIITINTPPLLPVANFIYTGAGKPAPCIVSFNNTSQNSTTYSWDFGDNGTSTGINPTHTYAAGGTYTVTLISSGPGGSNTIQKSINILNPIAPIASYTYTGAGNFAPCVVSFNNTSQNAISYSWSFGDGSTSILKNPSHTYTTGGVFTVALTATGPGGSNTTSQTVNILMPPTKVIISKVTIVSVPFTDSYGAGYDYYNGPDLYYDILNASGSIISSKSSSYYSDAASSNLPISWSYSPPNLSVTLLSSPISVSIYDHDSPDADDYMGSCGSIYLNSYPNYPSSITKTQGSVTITLDVTWQ